MHPTLQQDKFKDADFKYDNIFFQIPVEKYLTKALLVPDVGIFIFFHEILHSDKFQGADFKYDNLFSNTSPKLSESPIFGHKFKDFFFALNYLCFPSRQI